MFELTEASIDKPTETEASFNPTPQAIMQGITSAVGLDIAPNHSGVVLWEHNKLTRKGFKLAEYNKDNIHAEYYMRKNLKDYLKTILYNNHYEYVIIEDVYGGQNFDTTRKLIALNTVIDELICEGDVRVDNFIRWKESEWLKYFRMIYKLGGKPQVKYETQEILNYIQDDFYMQNKDLSNADKVRIFFEDICDASGMVYAVGMYKNFASLTQKEKKLAMKDIKFVYVNHKEDYLTVRDKVIKNSQPLEVQEPKGFTDHNSMILSICSKHADDVVCIPLPTNKLGIWGIKKKLEYYTDGEGYIYAYVKGLAE